MVKVDPVVRVRPVPPPARLLVMRWVATPEGLGCRWEVEDASWYAPASARPLVRERAAPRRLLRRLAQRVARAA